MTSGGPGPETLADLGEFGLIDALRAHLGTGPLVLVGPGDDAAHLALGQTGALVSTDLLIENKHFRRDWSSAYEIGRKAAAANLSDINAMGGTAIALTVGFAGPPSTPVEWALDLMRGIEDEASAVGAHVVGGDVSSADTVVLGITAIGEAATIITRDGARPGDIVAVAGTLGLAGAGYAALSRGFRSPKLAVDAHRLPTPPYGAGPEAAAAGATAMVDVSDGLLADLGHVAAASGVGIDLDPSAFEILEAVATVGEALQTDPLTYVLSGGDDYALAATFPSGAVVPSEWRIVGSAHDGSGMTVAGAAWDGPSGHTHYA